MSMVRIGLIVLFFFVFSFNGMSQDSDSIQTTSISLETQMLNISDPVMAVEEEPKEDRPPLFNRIWGPIGLSLLSVDLMRDSAKYGLQELARSFVADTFRTHVDDWLLWGPIPVMYGADLFKVPAKNTVWNQTKFLIISEAGTAAITWGLKLGLGIQRPNNGAFTAYPSGHTSQAFCQSQVLFNEFRDTAPLLAASGFLFSVPVAALRVLNNRHWVPDVLLGAGVAMLVTNLVYHFEPLKDWNPFKRKKNKTSEMMLVPSFRNDFMGARFQLRF
ncbi:MAG: phosphatase PAP2 family protein [Flavobacteriales bacterium]|nr:phosphatase PAP2 family protein [Flavobacteriales bacterium]